MRRAYVICKHDMIKHVVLNDRNLAKIKLEQFARQDYKLYYSVLYKTYFEYRSHLDRYITMVGYSSL